MIRTARRRTLGPLCVAVALACSSAGGALVFAGAVRDGSAIAGLDDPVAIAIAPDGSELFVAASGADAVAVFARDADTGALRATGVVRDGIAGAEGLDQPGDLALSPDGRHLYVAGFDADALAIFARDPARGSLRFEAVMRDRAGAVTGLGGAISVVVSPDGESVYVAGREDDSLVSFARDPATGRLRFVESLRDPGFGPASIAIAPDGRHVYAAGFDASAIAGYARDAATGRLRRVVMVRDEEDPAHALQNAASVAVSPDGRSVVAASYGEDALELFERDRATGALRRRATARAGIDAHERMRRPLGVAFHPSGRELYAAASEPGSLVAFDLRGGSMKPATVHHDAGADTVAEACAVAVSPDGDHVYVAGYGRSAIALFRRGD